MTPRPAMLFLATLALLAPGCGGPDPGDTVRDYFVAIVERDGQKACDQLTAQLRQDIERSPAAHAAGRSCADVMDLAAGLNPNLSVTDAEHLDVHVTTDGDRAVAKFYDPLSRRDETINLVRVGGDWRISTLQTRPKG